MSESFDIQSIISLFKASEYVSEAAYFLFFESLSMKKRNYSIVSKQVVLEFESDFDRKWVRQIAENHEYCLLKKFMAEIEGT